MSLLLLHLSMKGIMNWKNVQSVNKWENLCYTNLFSSKIMDGYDLRSKTCMYIINARKVVM